MTLQPSEYDISYFDRRKARDLSLSMHPAGFTKFTMDYPWYHAVYTPLMDSLKSNQYVGKKTLELGSAKGFYVEKFRELGVDAFGVDVSQYAYDEASEAVKPYLIIADARTHLATYKNNEFNLVWSVGFFECFDESDLPSLIGECNRISRYQYHVFYPGPNSDYCLVKPLSWWAQQGFTANKTRLKIHCRDEELDV